MRIIDKLHDYYDYLQNPEDNLVFDRRDSFILTKEAVCHGLHFSGGYDEEDFRFALLQCGATYWLLLFTITKYEKNVYGYSTGPVDYDIEVLATWKNYSKPRVVMELNIIYFTESWKYGIRYFDTKSIDASIKHFRKITSDLQHAVDNKEYEAVNDLGINIKTTECRGSYVREKQNIPILSACGISNIIAPEDMYNALDEHFALLKSDAETTVAEGTTNKDKIVNHGFDTKISFRGKT